MEINWLPTGVRFEQCICTTAYKFTHDASPAYMSDILEKSVLAQNTRRSNNKLTLPMKNTNNGQKSLSYLGPKFWNILPAGIKHSKSSNGFKHSLKSDYFKQLEKEEKDPYIYFLQIRGRYSNFK